MSVSSPPRSPALTLFHCMERFHREPLPFSQAVLGQYQCCAPELGRGQKLALALTLRILLLLGCRRALPSYSSIAMGAGDGCHLAKFLPSNFGGPTLVVEVSHQRGPLVQMLLSTCDNAPCLPSAQLFPIALGSSADAGAPSVVTHLRFPPSFTHCPPNMPLWWRSGMLPPLHIGDRGPKKAFH